MLSQLPLYYRPTAGRVEFSTVWADFTGGGCVPHPGVAAALLAGLPVQVPLTPFREVYRLPAGAVLSAPGGRPAVAFTGFDWHELLPRRRSWGRAGPAGALREALQAAADDARCARVGVSGGTGSAALARAVPDAERVHVSAGLPVPGPAPDRLPAKTVILDGTPVWQAQCAQAQVPLPAGCGPWPAPALLDGQVLTGAGLGALFGRGGLQAPPRAGWWRRGWQHLTADPPLPGLVGQPWWRAWHPSPATPAAGGVQGTAAGGQGAGPWWGEELLRHAMLASGAHSHLLSAQDDERLRAALVPVVTLADDAAALDGWDAADRAALVHIALHPQVLGVALALRAGERWHRSNGQTLDAPLLRSLAGTGAADLPAAARAQLASAALVQQRLSGPQARALLLQETAASPWIHTGRLQAVLDDPQARMHHSLALHRLLHVTTTCPGVLRSPQ
ncbi:hypothetical protein [Streptomyces sp. NBC_00354]|uniref:hypothetical protein n=1 Tax=Streptomyces sp. NBC_00354 TaxID=2975723 RepID=UPI002E260B66